MRPRVCSGSKIIVSRLKTMREAHEYYKPILFEGKDVKLLDVFKDKLKDVFDNDIVEKFG